MTGRIDEQAAVNVLLTGFSAFPGAPFNPTEALVTELRTRKADFARHSIRLEARVLPVVYAAIGPAIAELVKTLAPDAILHFGLATQRSRLSIETRAHNRVGHAEDAAGRRAEVSTVVRGGLPVLEASVPTAEIAANLRQAGYACDLSEDAGDYLCNAALYLSLAAPHAAQVGFIHVPPLRQSASGDCGLGEQHLLTMPQLLHAAETIVFTTAGAVRRSS